MKVIIRGKNIELTDALRLHVEKRLSKLDKFLKDEQEVQVTLLVEKDRQRVEVTIPLTGVIVRGEEETGDMYSSIDMIIDKLESQMKKYKTKLAKKLKNGSIKDLGDNGRSRNDVEEPQVMRTKKFAIKPMPVDEAIMQMNLLGHNFFVFSNAETEEVNVVYLRKDGNYGLIEPHFS